MHLATSAQAQHDGIEGVTYSPRDGLIMYAVRIVTLALTAAAARADAAALAMFSSLIVWVFSPFSGGLLVSDASSI